MTSTTTSVKSSKTVAPAPRFLPLQTIPVRLSSARLEKTPPTFGIVSNMSETGACVITNRELPENSVMTLEIRTKQKERLTLQVRVVWCAERLEPVKEIVGFLTGVSFVAESPDRIRDLLECGIFQLVP